MMNKKYKLVEVYCVEKDILNVENVEGSSKKDVVKSKWDSIDKNELREEMGSDWKDWFSNEGKYIIWGEENCIVCIEEGEDVFDIIKDVDSSKWSEEVVLYIDKKNGEVYCRMLEEDGNRYKIEKDGSIKV